MNVNFIRRGASLMVTASCILGLSCGKPSTSKPGHEASSLDAPKYSREKHWIVGEVVLDVAEMVAFAEDPTRMPAFGIVVGDATTPEAPSVTVALKRAGEVADSAPIEFTDFVWNPANYVPLCERLVKAEKPARAPAAGAPDEGLLTRLLEADGEALETESRRTSSALASNILDATAHEEAAMILAALGLRESAWIFDDTRSTLNRMAAHLALARALRSGASPSTSGAVAEIALQTLCRRERAALDAIDKFKAEHPGGAAIGSWMSVLALRNTHDWRNGRGTGRAPLVERLEFFRALCVSLDSSAACERVDRRKPAAVPDWSWIVFANRFGVEEGHLFSQAGLELTLNEMGAVWQAYHGAPLKQQEMDEALNTAPGRCIVSGPSGKPTPRVIGWGCWSSFYQRHLAHVAMRTVYFMRSLWGVEDEAAQYESVMMKSFGKLDLFAVNARAWATDADSYRAAFKRGADVTTSRPWRMNYEAWHFMRIRSPHAAFPGGLPDENVWYIPALPNGTAVDLDNRLADHSVMVAMSADELAKVAELAPFERDLCRAWAERSPGGKPTDAEASHIFGALADYDQAVMDDAASRVADNPTEYEARMKKLCEINPDYLLDLASYYVNIGETNKAVETYAKGLRVAHDRVGAANNSKWLVDYYFDHGMTNKAMELADEAAEVYSARGLAAKAGLMEKMGQLDEAEAWYIKIAERYEQYGELMAFYHRHAAAKAEDGRTFGEKIRGISGHVFPSGMKTVTLADFSGGPPTSGVLWAGSTRLSSSFGLNKGVVVVALDGYRVDNKEQYELVRDLKAEPKMTMIIWDLNTYRAIEPTVEGRRFGCRIETYEP